MTDLFGDGRLLPVIASPNSQPRVSLHVNENSGKGLRPISSTHVVRRIYRRKHGAPVQGAERGAGASRSWVRSTPSLESKKSQTLRMTISWEPGAGEAPEGRTAESLATLRDDKKERASEKRGPLPKDRTVVGTVGTSTAAPFCAKSKKSQPLRMTISWEPSACEAPKGRTADPSLRSG